MTTDSDPDRDADRSGGDDYDPFEHVPDRIDAVTASGLEQLHDALATRNRAKLRSASVERQAHLLWASIEQGTIDLDVGTRERE